MWFRLFATALVPLIALTYFNTKILIYYRNNNFTRAHTVMRRMRVKGPDEEAVPVNRPQELRVQIQTGRTVQQPRTTTTRMIENGIELNNGALPPPKTPLYKASRERTLFIMLCCITMTFFFCHLPR